MDIEKAYKVMSDASGIGRGDTVKVLRKASRREMGWDNSWSDRMDAFVGKECEVRSYSEMTGFVLFCGEFDVGYGFPFFVLEKIKPVLPASFKLNSDYKVEFEEGGVIKFGCQTVDFETIEKIYETAKSVRE
jgi:hypothetical protein